MKSIFVIIMMMTVTGCLDAHKHDLPPGICDQVVSYTLVFKDGHTEYREKWFSHDTAQFFKNTIETSLVVKALLLESGVTNTKDWTFTNVPWYDCFRGPKQ